jgi:hypothetical protein
MSAAVERRAGTNVRDWVQVTRKERPAKSTIAISVAILVSWSIVALTLLSGSWYREDDSRSSPDKEPVNFELRKSLIPGEFSCQPENCGKRAARDALSILHMAAKPV